MGSVYSQKRRVCLNKLYETNRALFWLVTCIIASIFWGAFQSSLWAGMIYGGILFIFAMIYEVLANKKDRTKK